MKRLVPLLAAAALLASCGGDDDAAAPTTAAATTAPATTLRATTLPATTEATTTAPTTTAAATTTAVTTTVPAATTTAPCPVRDSTAEMQERFPGGLSGLAGVRLASAPHDCYDRLVLRLAPAPDNPTPLEFPGFWVRYADGPVTLGQSEEPVEIRGDAVLLITVESWMYDSDAAGNPTDYRGLGELAAPGLQVVQEIRLVDNFEGVHTWAVGLDRERSFEVTVLRSPDRLVVDIRT